MTIAQCKAFRKRCITGDLAERFKPKKGHRHASFANNSQRKAAARVRKRQQAGKLGGSIGGRAK